MNFLHLVEMPLNIRNIGSLYSTITRMVNAAEIREVEPIKVAYNIYKIVDEGSSMLYFYIDNDLVISGVFLVMQRPGVFKISTVGKHPDYIGRKPYTIDIYRAIINDLGTNEALLSDSQLTEDSIKIWKRLVKEFPGKVAIYDRTTREVTPITNTNDINRVFGIAPEQLKYQFMIRGQQGSSDTERIQKLAGIKKEQT